MDEQKIKYTHETVIRMLEQDLKEKEIPTMRQNATDDTPETLNYVVGGVGLDGDEVLGEAMFLPNTPEDFFYTFISSMLLSDEIDEAYLDEVIVAISILNFYVPMGSFLYSATDKMLVYRNSAMISFDLPMKQIYKQAALLVEKTYEQVDKYVEILLKISEGQSNTDELIGLFGY